MYTVQEVKQVRETESYKFGCGNETPQDFRICKSAYFEHFYGCYEQTVLTSSDKNQNLTVVFCQYVWRADLSSVVAGFRTTARLTCSDYLEISSFRYVLLAFHSDMAGGKIGFTTANNFQIFICIEVQLEFLFVFKRHFKSVAISFIQQGVI